MLGFEAVQSREVLGGVEFLLGLSGKRREVLGVPEPGFFQLPGLGQALERVGADHLQHADPGFAIGAVGDGDEADVHELGDDLQRVAEPSSATAARALRSQPPANTPIRARAVAVAGANRS